MEPSTLPSTFPQNLSFPVPSHPHLLFLAHLTFLSSSTSTTTTILHLTTNPLSSPSTLSPLGSFVYALPDRLSTSNTISTPLTTSQNTIEYATRLAKILARKLNGPVYVGCSIEVEGMTVEEEMEGLREVVGRVFGVVGGGEGEANREGEGE